MSFENLQKQTNHLLQINKRGTGAFEVMIQSFALPGIALSEAGGPAPKIAGFSVVGTSVGYSDLVCKVLLDENMNSYFDIYKWVKELCEPEKHNGVKFNDSVSEASLYVLTNNKTTDTKFIVNFHRLWPVNLGEIQFDTTTTDDQVITVDVTFKYRTFTINRDGVEY